MNRYPQIPRQIHNTVVFQSSTERMAKINGTYCTMSRNGGKKCSKKQPLWWRKEIKYKDTKRNIREKITKEWSFSDCLFLNKMIILFPQVKKLDQYTVDSNLVQAQQKHQHLTGKFTGEAYLHGEYMQLWAVWADYHRN